ncbi:MAG: hypothetical protein ACI9JN_001443 [Bacteroidia bacterium]|jgi:hypothetical protein
MLLLVLFSTILAHSILPHVHHDHENITSLKEKPHHHHHHADIKHHHSYDENYCDHKETESLLDYILGHHSHSGFNEEYTTEVTRIIRKTDVNNTLVYHVTKGIQQESILVSILKKAPEQFQNIKLGTPFLLSCSLTAPPSLV